MTRENQFLVDQMGSMRATRGDIQRLLVAFGRHLRHDHGYSRRRTAEMLGVRERWVRDEVE